MTYGYGIDIGGTTVKLGLFSEDGTLQDQWSIPTDTSGHGAHIPGDIAASVLADMKKRPFHRDAYLGLGVGAPGQIWPDGTASAVNLGWDHQPLLPVLERLTGLRAVGDNDANLAAMGEAWRGGGMGYNSMVLVTLGTGVGGGIILDGKCLRGAHRAGGEIGHIPVNPHETRPCNCGGHGCLEQYASATGCARLAREALTASTEPSALRNLPDPDARAVWNAANAGDPLALRIADQYCAYLARGLAVVASTVDPEAIVLGGGVSHAGKLLLDMTRAHYRPLAFPACKDTPIILATLSNDAGIYGAMATLIAEQ